MSMKKGLENKKTILVVDDEEIMRSFLGDLLEDDDYNVEQVSSGEEAIASVKKKHYDLVITDIRLQGKDGFDVLSEIKKISPETKVVLITGYSLDEEGKEYINKGADGFLLKPFDISNVREITKKLLS